MTREPDRTPCACRPSASLWARNLRSLLHSDAAGGAVLLLAAAAALAWANSPYGAAYYALWQAPLPLPIGRDARAWPLQLLINEVLMTAFFLLVGIEIRHELRDGMLSGFRRAALPVAAALGGVLAPAALYLLVTDQAPLRRGWAVPTATDIAFAVGVLALLGRWVPRELRMLLLTLAIVDDIAAVLIIALSYSAGIEAGGLLIGGAALFGALALRRAGVASLWAYAGPGAVLWFGLHQAGIHPALAGVVLGMLAPAEGGPKARVGARPARTPEETLRPWIALGVMPLFALANAGVTLRGIDLAAEDTRSAALGVFVALLAGKPAGVMAASWIAVRLGWARLPSGIGWPGVFLVALLAGIGFTMSIFIALLAFPDGRLLAGAKLGVLLASLAAGTLGLAWGQALRRRSRPAGRDVMASSLPPGP